MTSDKAAKLAAALKIVADIHEQATAAEATPPCRDKTYLEARERAVSFIGLDTGKSSGRVQQKLQNLGYDEAVAGRVAQDLQAAGYIDDYKACAKIARRHQGSKSKSRYYLKQLFLRQGVPAEVAENFVDRLPEDSESILYLLPDSLPSTPQAQAKCMRFLASRGYATATIRAAMGTLRKDEES